MLKRNVQFKSKDKRDALYLNLPPLPSENKKNKNKWIIFGCMLWFVIIGSIEIHSMFETNATAEVNEFMYEERVSENEDLDSLLLEYTEMYGLKDHLAELKAIVEVESGGYAEDVFQSSESLGLEPNSLSKEESVAQGCGYYKRLLDKASELSLDQDSVFQAYNYGIGFLDYVYEHGGKYSKELAINFAEEHSDNKK